MASQIEKFAQSLAVELASVRERIRGLESELEILRGLDAEVAVLKSQVAELVKARDAWGQRGWMVVIALIGAIVSIGSALLGASLNAKR